MSDGRHHARLGASSSHRYMVCAASANLIAQLPETLRDNSSGHSTTGTLAHDLIERCLKAGFSPYDFATRPPYSERLSAKDFRAIDEFFIFVDAVFPDGMPRGTYVEKFFSLHADKDVGCWVDFVASPRPGHLLVVDYKHGFQDVEAMENSQLLIQAACVLDNVEGEFETVSIAIVQPNGLGDLVSIADYTVEEIRQWVADELLPATKRTRSKNAELKPGPHCAKSFCPARAVCPALRQRVRDILTVKGVYMPKPDKISRKQLGAMLDNEALIKNYFAQLKEYALAEAKAGRPPVGYELKTGRARREYVSDPEKVLAKHFGGKVPRELYKEKQLRPITELEKILPRLTDNHAAIAKALTKTKAADTVLKPGDDRAIPSAITADFETLD